MTQKLTLPEAIDAFGLDTRTLDKVVAIAQWLMTLCDEKKPIEEAETEFRARRIEGYFKAAERARVNGDHLLAFANVEDCLAEVKEYRDQLAGRLGANSAKELEALKREADMHGDYLNEICLRSRTGGG